VTLNIGGVQCPCEWLHVTADLGVSAAPRSKPLERLNCRRGVNIGSEEAVKGLKHVLMGNRNQSRLNINLVANNSKAPSILGLLILNRVSAENGFAHCLGHSEFVSKIPALANAEYVIHVHESLASQTLAKLKRDRSGNHLEACRGTSPTEDAAQKEHDQRLGHLHSKEASILRAEREESICPLQVHLP
jgi:hypothetical protein